MSLSLSRSRRPLVTTGLSALLALTVLSGCADEEPTNNGPTTGVVEDDAATSAADDAAATSADDAAATSSAPATDDAAATSAAPLVLAGKEDDFELTLPAGWVDASELVDTAGVQLAGKAPEQEDGFFVNVLVTKEKYVKNLTSAVEATAKELAGKDGEYEILEPAPVDGNKAPGYTIKRTVRGKDLVQTQRWISHKGTLYVATLSALESQAEEATPLLDEMLASWKWTD